MKSKHLRYNDIDDFDSVKSGDVVEIRDFVPYIKNTESIDTIPWETKEYYLLNGTHGNMLSVDAVLPITPETPYDSIDFSTKGMPEVITIDLKLEGKYAIWAGSAAIDLALDDEGFAAVVLESGGRYGRRIGIEEGREYLVFWKNAELKSTKLHIRIPYGTFPSTPNIKASLSCLRFIKLSEDADLTPVPGKADRDFILVIDGFSHYFTYGTPGECFDLRLSHVYENTDVKILMPQVMGPLLWKSEVNSYLGEGVTPDKYSGRRIGDVRVFKYVEDSIKNGYDVLRVLPEDCHRRGMEVHFSIRANLYFNPDDDFFLKGEGDLNGRWWAEHPEVRRPGELQLDYGKPEVREYYLSVFRDVLEKFDVDGINLDLTRWPKVFDPRYNSSDVLIDFCRELRALADSFGEKRGKHIQVSLLMVEYYHSGCTLEEQAIDFTGLMKSGTLDFVCIQTNEPKKYAAIAHQYGVKFMGIVDGCTPYYNHNDDDPLWKLPDGSITTDPRAGQEFKKEKFIGTVQAPFEKIRLMDMYYENSADGIAAVNLFMGSLYIRSCGHSEIVRQHAENGTVFGQKPGEYIFFV
ncbi:MAG: hypothetical protein ACOX4O_02220 [Eubacteriales bacterium]|jgi:hypothetical protein